jgi:uncharacterized protein involved in exopolysaccharide biosynthesis
MDDRSSRKDDPDGAPGGLIGELRLLVRYRRMVLIVVGLSTVAAVVYSLLTPEVFEAHTTLLPAEEQSSMFGGLSQFLQNLPIQGANLPGVTTTTDLMSGMLQSRRIQQPVIEEFGLLNRFESENLDEAFHEFNTRLRTSVADEGILHVRFRDRDPVMAADVLNALVAQLNHYNVNVRANRGRLTREFIRLRLDETERDLALAEEQLRDYQQAHAMAISPEDISAAETVGGLIARQMELRVEIDALSEFMDPRSPPILQRQMELDALDREIASLPELGLDVVRLYRDLKVQEQLFLLLNAQLEQARIDEKRDLPTIQVLDAARAPDLRAWPRRKLIVIGGFLVSAALAVLLAHGLAYVDRERATLKRIFASSSR